MPEGLAFDFIADRDAGGGHAPVMTGHDSGLITINLAEADDPERERQRFEMGEAYRTLLGHFRHEIAHYYWGRLVARSSYLQEFRNIFGDERKNYVTALQAALCARPAAGLAGAFRDRLCERAPLGGLRGDLGALLPHGRYAGDRGRVRHQPAAEGRQGGRAGGQDRFRSASGALDRIIEAWLPLTFAVNSINRSMGLPDLYPFVLAPPVIVKLAFLHRLIETRSRPQARATGTSTIRAIVASLRRPVGSPESS